MTHTNPHLTGGGLHHVALRTADFEKSFAFYTLTMGFKPRMQWHTGERRAVMLDVGDGNYVELFEHPEPDSAGTVPNEARLLHFCLRCRNIDATIERVRSAGMVVTTEPKDVKVSNVADGHAGDVTLRLAFFRGPDGETIELMDCPQL